MMPNNHYWYWKELLEEKEDAAEDMVIAYLRKKYGYC